MMKEGPNEFKDRATVVLSEPAPTVDEENRIKALFEAFKKQEEEIKKARDYTNLSRIEIARSRKKVYELTRNLKSIRNFFLTALFLGSLSMFALPHTLLGVLSASLTGTLSALTIHFAPNIFNYCRYLLMSSKEYEQAQIEDEISQYKWLKFELGYDDYPAPQMINDIENHLGNPATVTWLNERLRKIASAKVQEVPELEEALEQEINDKYKIKKV